MAENSAIEWTTHTFNPWQGCAKVSAGCANCYAEHLMDARLGRVKWGVNGTRVRTSAAYWKQPLKWNREAERDGTRPRVFCASLADVFEDRPELVSWRADLFALIRDTPHLDWLLLTKRPENVVPMIEAIAERLRETRPGDAGGTSHDRTEGMMNAWLNGCPPSNVWLGTSVEDSDARKRITEMLLVDASVHFLSMEPLLGPVDLSPWFAHHEECVMCGEEFEEVEEDRCPACLSEGTMNRVYDATEETSSPISWVIVGGESGHNARPMHPDWARAIRDQCVEAGVRFLFKQWGEYTPRETWGESTGAKHIFDDGVFVNRVGKKAAGRELDGRTWDEYPQAHEARDA